MIVQLTPDHKFVCDRCGREEYFFAEEGTKSIEIAEVAFVSGIFARTRKEGQVCKACGDEFLELADNFFSEVNKESNNEQRKED